MKFFCAKIKIAEMAEMDVVDNVTITINGAELGSLKVRELKKLLEKRCIPNTGKKTLLKNKLERVCLRERLLQLDAEIGDTDDVDMTQRTSQTQEAEQPSAEASGSNEEDADDVYLRAHKVTQCLLLQLTEQLNQPRHNLGSTFKGFECKPPGDDQRTTEQIISEHKRLQRYAEKNNLTPSGYCYRLAKETSIKKFTCFMCLATYDSITGFQSHVQSCKKLQKYATSVPVQFLQFLPESSKDLKKQRKQANPNHIVDTVNATTVYIDVGDSVDIYHGEDLVGWGIVVDRTDDVHEINYILDGELKLTINEVQEGKDKHPTYDNSP